MRIIMKIQLHQEESSSDESGPEALNPTAILSHLEEEISNFDIIFEKVQEHLVSFEMRIQQLNIYTLTPLTADVSLWCEKKGLLSPLSLDTWFKAVLLDTESTDLKTRMLYFKEPVPWSNKNINVFDLLRGLPRWFSFSKNKGNSH